MIQNNFCIHVGGKHVDRQVVAEVATPPPTKSENSQRLHVPIPHIRLVEEVEKQLDGFGYMIADEAHALNKEGGNYFGMLQIEAKDESARALDYASVIGLRNSHIKQYGASFAMGSRVFVCDNLAFSGEINLSRAHTRHIDRDLPNVIAHGLGRVATAKVHQDERIAAYKEYNLERIEADSLIVDMLRKKAILPSHMATVLEEWDNPRHEEFKDGGRTAWRLFNATTEALKGSINALPKRTITIHSMLDRVTGVEFSDVPALPEEAKAVA